MGQLALIVSPAKELIFFKIPHVLLLVLQTLLKRMENALFAILLVQHVLIRVPIVVLHVFLTNTSPQYHKLAMTLVPQTISKMKIRKSANPATKLALSALEPDLLIVQTALLTLLKTLRPTPVNL